MIEYNWRSYNMIVGGSDSADMGRHNIDNSLEWAII